MVLSRQMKMNMVKVGVITLCFILINMFFFYFNYALIMSPFSEGPSEFFDFRTSLLTNLLTGLVAGLLGGTLLVFVNDSVFRRKSFIFSILATIISYVLIFAVVTIIASIANLIAISGLDSVDLDSVKRALLVVVNLSLVTTFTLWGAITLLTLFFLQVNDKFGPGVLLKFLAGKYHSPRKEDRFFMFMDMRSSTTIAEMIGNEKYFDLLNDLFADITKTIINREGEIYQYVGDEIVISWTIKKGARKANCLRCFTEVQQTLSELAPLYEEKYGVRPEFKAGLHYGSVMAGEVGVIKKDIIYSGDVLNTSARIQEQCNHYGVDFLISKQAFDLIADTDGYDRVQLGSIELRGKKRKIDLITLSIN